VVTLTRGFWVGKYEVTQSQWKHVVGEFPGKLTAGGGDDFHAKLPGGVDPDL
jgi:formylglycine-generating enzyme required for sulfatase activity